MSANWHECKNCNAKVGPSEGKYHECYRHNQYFQERGDEDTERLIERRMSGGKRVQH